MAVYTVKLQDVNSSLNLRSSASTTSTILAKIKHGTQLTEVAGSVAGWKKVQYGNAQGFVSDQYVVLNSSPTAIVTSAVQNAKTAVAQQVATSSPINTPSSSQRTISQLSNSISTNNNNNSNSMALPQMTEATKKKITIGLVVVGVAVAGFAVYKLTAGKKQQPALSQARCRPL